MYIFLNIFKIYIFVYVYLRKVYTFAGAGSRPFQRLMPKFHLQATSILEDFISTLFLANEHKGK